MAAQALIRRIPVGEGVLDAILRLVRSARPENSPVEAVRKQLLENTKGRDSVLGTYDIDQNGDTTLKDMSVFRVQGTDIPFERAIAVDATLLEG